VHAAAWVTLGECEWVPPSVLKRSIDINFIGLARLTQVYTLQISKDIRYNNTAYNTLHFLFFFSLILSLLFSQVFLPLIRRSKGRIVFVSSLLARVPSPVRGIYCALKVNLFYQLHCSVFLTR